MAQGGTPREQLRPGWAKGRDSEAEGQVVPESAG
jgi:hypothetical protein